MEYLFTFRVRIDAVDDAAARIEAHAVSHVIAEALRNFVGKENPPYWTEEKLQENLKGQPPRSVKM